MAFIPVETEKNGDMRSLGIDEPQKSVYGYSTLHILDAGEIILEASGVYRRER